MYCGLTIPDLIILLGYFLIVIGITVAASRFIKNREDFIMGGRRFGKLMTTMFTFASGTHADAAVGVAAQCYKIGSFAGFWYQGVMIITLPFYWLISPIFRRARVMTTADFFERRFGKGFMLLYAIFSLFVLIGFSSVSLYGASKLVESLTGGQIPWRVSIVVIAVVAFCYGIIGGLVAAVWNDLFQGILTVVMSLLIIPFFWSHIGGLHGFQAALGDSKHAFQLVLQEGMTKYWILMMSLNSLLRMVVQPHIMANAGSAKTEMDSRVGFIGGLVLKRLMTIPWALTGVMAVAMYGAGNIDPDQVFGRMTRDLLPSGFAGLMLACVLASTMDGITAEMVASAGIYTNSLHRKIFPQQGEHALLNVSRWASVAFALIVIPLSYQFTDMPGAMRFLFKTVPLMGIAFVLAVLWRRANRYGAVASFLVATGALLFTQYILKWRGDQGLPSTILLYVSLGTLAGFVVSLLTPPEDAGRTNRFFLLMRTRIGNEQVLRDAGLVEIPGTGTFEDPILDGSCELPMPDNAGATRIVKPSKETLYGFLVVGVIALALLGFVAALATWLEQG
jgi:SSS family solute:Na+ symporter